MAIESTEKKSILKILSLWPFSRGGSHLVSQHKLTDTSYELVFLDYLQLPLNA